MRAAAPRDLAPVLALLGAEGLPAEGVREAFAGFVVAEDAGTVVGAAGVERHGRFALLRSVVVAPSHRRRGVARALVAAAARRARGNGLRALYLLTETAPECFGALGFVRVRRADAPGAIRASAEFARLCSDSAIAMRLRLA